MTDIRFKNLDKFTVSKSGDERTLSMSRPQTSSGKMRERCPNTECQPAIFFMGKAPEAQTIDDENKNTIRRQPGTEGVTCPYCGVDGDDEDFIAQEDIDHAHKEIMHAVGKDIGAFLGDMTKGFNRQNRSKPGDFLSISMDYKEKHNPRPLAYREDLLRDISCHICGREYGVYALALFCPDCGSPNVSTHFDREVDIIGQQIEISKLVNSNENKEISYRLLANAHEDALTALETTLKAVHRYLVHTRHPDQASKLEKIGNTFQNLEKAERKFKAIQVNLLGELSDIEKETLFKAIQKRHVIGHNLGLADEKYTQLAEDAPVGQTVPILAEEIEQFAKLCAKIIHSVEKELEQKSGGQNGS